VGAAPESRPGPPAPAGRTVPDPTLDHLLPIRHHAWVAREGELVTVLVPKFTSRFARRWFVPLLAKPDLRVHLDAVGSFVWDQCDGTATIREIGARVAARFGGDTDARREDVIRFVRKLVREESLSFQQPGRPAEQSRGAAPDAPTV
jgi:hypothetical protein